MIGMATLNVLLIYNNTDTNGYNWILVGPFIESQFVSKKLLVQFRVDKVLSHY